MIEQFKVMWKVNKMNYLEECGGFREKRDFSEKKLNTTLLDIGIRCIGGINTMIALICLCFILKPQKTIYINTLYKLTL